jgi:hypothetical protein
VRIHVHLTEEKAGRLSEIAMKSDDSIASLISQAIDRFILDAKPDRSALYLIAESVVGKYKSDKDDISVKHDRSQDKDFDS